MNTLVTLALSATLVSLLAHGGSAQSAEGSTDGRAGVLRLAGTGVQIYACKPAADHSAWTFEHPEATLADDRGQVVLQHGAGPSWTARDGSVVFGAVIASVPSPDAGSVPWLVLRASKHEGPPGGGANLGRAGQLSGVAFVLRTDTVGGAAPAGGCDAGHDGAQLRVPYTAIYTFLTEPEAAH